MSALMSSILLSVVSAVCYAAAAIVQERLAATTAPSRYALLRSGRWWVAVVLNGIGALLHVAALGLGPLTVVQPLGVLTIVIAAPMAAVMVKRPVTAAAWRGIALVSIGLAGILMFTGAHQSRPLSETEQYLVAAVAATTIAGLLGIAKMASGLRRPGARSVALAMAAGVAFGTASVCVKTVAEGWALTSIAEALPVLLLVAVFAVTGLATAQASYRGGGLAAPLATATVVNPVVAAAVGLALLEEGFRFGVPGALTALAAAVVTGWGLTILTGDSVARRHTPDGGQPPAVVIPAPTTHTGGTAVSAPRPAPQSSSLPASPPASPPAQSLAHPPPRAAPGSASEALRESTRHRIPVPTRPC
ncbi:DMT family transporter [Streptomyces sp. N2-109]|uniref:DMT family transporter n=1 Tax=Streptomyces gossypii TaxID=2883101 RepID=A0ABT2K1F1_9ACTN|nr:DMT family transporter [Streptomyces gossypii]MCT2594002.1 DMT family transporter [Streptomyces gossypii]